MEAAVQDRPETANGNGEEPLDGEHAEDQAPPALPPVELEGSGDQLTLKITGDRPDKATAKLRGGKIEIPAGEYQPGDVIETVTRLRCVRVAVVDKMNNTTGERTEREREHQFKLMGIEKIAS